MITDSDRNRDRIIRWTLIVYAVTFLVNFAMYLFRQNNVLFFLLGGYGMMWVPGLVGIVFAARGRRRMELGVKLAPIKYFLIALLLPLIAHALWVALSVSSFTRTTQVQSLATPFFAMPGTKGFPFIVLVLGNQLLLVILGCVERITRTMGEELGWRGWLHPKIASLYGPVTTTLIVGLIWGFWHAPLILMGHNFPEQRVLGAFLLMPALSVGLAFPLAWLRDHSGSVWPCTLFHASMNTTSSLAVAWAGRDSVPSSIVALWIVIGGAFALLMRDKRSRALTSA